MEQQQQEQDKAKESQAKRGRIDTSGFEAARPNFMQISVEEYVGISPTVFNIPTKDKANDLAGFDAQKTVDAIFRLMYLPENELSKYIELIAERAVGLDALWESNPRRLSQKGLPLGVLERLRTMTDKKGNRVMPGFICQDTPSPMESLKKKLEDDILRSCSSVEILHLLVPMQSYKLLAETALPRDNTRRVTDNLDHVEVKTQELAYAVVSSTKEVLQSLKPSKEYFGAAEYDYDPYMAPKPLSHRPTQLTVEEENA